MTKKEIANLLKDYRWMIYEIARQRGMADDIGENITAQYGIESVMPKPQGGSTDPVYIEVQRRVKKTKRIEKLEKKVKFIQERMDRIEGDREKAVLDCLLDGMSIIAISRHMGLSQRHIQRIRDEIVEQMSEMSEMSGMSERLQQEKACV